MNAMSRRKSFLSTLYNFRQTVPCGVFNYEEEAKIQPYKIWPFVVAGGNGITVFCLCIRASPRTHRIRASANARL